MKLNKKALDQVKLDVIDLSVDSTLSDLTSAMKNLSALAFEAPPTPQEIPDLRSLADDLAKYLEQTQLESD